MSDPTCMVYFRSGSLALDDAGRLLASRGLEVARAGDGLAVRMGAGPQLRIRFARGPQVTADATRLGGTTRHAAAMRECDARFEVTFDDLESVLDEMNTLMEVQMTLQEATGGCLYTAWNGALTR